MRFVTPRSAALLAAVGLIALCMTTPSNADSVLAGWDLFQTETGTTFDGVAFSGVPIGTSFTFPATNPEGNPINPRNPNLGVTDTIIERNQNVTAAPGGSGTTTLTFDALQLVTTAPVAAGTFGPGSLAGNYYITLNPTVASTGTMTINFANPTPGPPPPAQPIGGTFSSTLDVNYELHFGALNGTFVATGSVTLSNSGNVEWSHYPQPTQVQITNVNSFLNTVDHSNDFFLLGELTEKEPGAIHLVEEAGSIPEPSSIVSGSLGLIFGAALYRRFRRKRSA
jgi:hypothetical protein